jgi:SEC-C motif-containing protein
LPCLRGEKRALTAEALMRSRFTAFCHGDADYLMATHHPASHSANERGDLTRSLAATEWLNLTVLECEAGRQGDSEGIVEFVAAFRMRAGLVMGSGAGQTGQMHERSRFIFEGGRWFYVDGDQLPAYVPKQGAPCWCGSGKKYKRCHG